MKDKPSCKMVSRSAIALAASVAFGYAGIALAACPVETAADGMRITDGSHCEAFLSAYNKTAGIFGVLHTVGLGAQLTHNGTPTITVSSSSDYAYGVIAEGDSEIFVRGATVNQTGTGQSSSGVRASDSAKITFTENLTITTSSIGSRGVYVSGPVSGTSAEVILNDNGTSTTSITTNGLSAPAFQIGKMPAPAHGSGTLSAKGRLEATTTALSIETPLASSTSPALYLGYSGSLFEAAYPTSSGFLRSRTRTVLLDAGTGMAVNMRDYTVSSTGSGTTMATIYVGGGAVDSAITFYGSTVSAPGSGYLMLSEGRAINATSFVPTGTAGVVPSNVALFAEAQTQLTGSIRTHTSSVLEVTLDDSTWTLAGYGSSLSTESTLTSLTLQNGAVLNAGAGAAIANFTVTAGAVYNTGGNISLADGGVSDRLTINSDLTLANGRISIDTELNDDTSSTDRLVVTGDMTGNGVLNVTNVGGLGAATTNGILVVEVQGNASGATLSLAAPLIVDEWQYSLVKNGNNWYLRSHQRGPANVTPVPVNAPWAMAILGLMISGFVFRTLRRRQT
ncbi:MAG: autotransporter outer membrane beta-barrel domain-containing protein [Burkholderiales bacterium]|jgi:autotransporter family porin|nr:autotransporter outer membrane beta-barrel domain-containing protein [Burkholderiales bacterium]